MGARMRRNKLVMSMTHRQFLVLARRRKVRGASSFFGLLLTLFSECAPPDKDIEMRPSCDSFEDSEWGLIDDEVRFGEAADVLAFFLNETWPLSW